MVLCWKGAGPKPNCRRVLIRVKESVRIRTHRSGLRYLPNLTWAQWIVAGLIYFVSLDFINIVILYFILIYVHVGSVLFCLNEGNYVCKRHFLEMSWSYVLFDLKFENVVNKLKSFNAFDLSLKKACWFRMKEWFKVVVIFLHEEKSLILFCAMF